MKKMTQVILCLIGVWGSSWAQMDDNYIEEKYADFEREFADEAAVNKPSANKETSEHNEPAKDVAADSSVLKTAEESVAEAQVNEPSSIEVPAVETPVAESSDAEAEQAAAEVAESADEESAETENAQFDEKEEISASDAEAMAAATPAQADSSAPETLDFSTWINPACKPVHTTSPYSIRKGRLHRGVDVKVAIGDSIVAVAPGKVIISKYNKGGYGHYIVLKHENGTQTVYGHLSKRLKNVGDRVDQGQLIGLGGNTGRSTGSHLHFEIRYGDINIDPSTVINFDEGKLLDNVDKYSVAEATASHKEIQKELSKHRTHKIRPGDTLGKLALKYGTTIDRICKLNKINRNTILRIGKILQIS
ncbi:MAG: peptidoglycan DD-metalloendopeptidase family protein [Fibrobacter sp.]|nr:peptidoglycan DD-metalloendopeptidase family protein [Fibrobacter sp.]